VTGSPHTALRTLRGGAGGRLVAAVLAASALLAGAAQPATAGSRPFTTGVTNIGTHAPLGFEQARATGARFIRIPLYWAGTAPVALPPGWNPEDPEDPHYRWGESDIDVVRAYNAGLTPVLQVDGAPAWAQRCQTPAAVAPAICDPDPAALRAFAVAAARRYSGQVPGLPRVSYWQALNEPNLSLFFFPQFDTSGRTLSPYFYRDLINAFYAGIKGVDPANLVIAAGLGPIAIPKWTIGPMSFARQLLCMRTNLRPTRDSCGGGVHFDIFAIQPYTTGGPSHEGKVNDVQLGDLAKLQELIEAADRAGRIVSAFPRTPLWITEFSWDTKPPDPGGLPMRIAARWTAEALYAAWRAGVANFFWYSLNDSVPDPSRHPSLTLESGLYFRGATPAQDQPKRVFYAFRFPLVAYPREGGLAVWGKTPTSGPGRVRIQLRLDGRWRNALVAEADGQGIFQARLPTAYGSGHRGSARAKFGTVSSVPFSMRPVPDFRHPPFGEKPG
jgi:hypothetical protein